jgi:UDP-N-acetylmuramoylalanine--D-glutamate ligase
MKPTLFGYGLTTKAIASSLGGGCIFFDDNTTKSYIDDNNNRIYPSSKFDPEKSSLEVTTPSVPPSHPLIKRAKNLVSEYDYFYNDMPFSIWISGTNGKTTTTQMLTHLLKDKGAVSGGNIGTPLAFLDKNAPIWILESSSFTLYHTKRATPNIYLLLPITPDHIDWHGSFEEYIRAKLSPIERMREGELALIPKGLKSKVKDSSAFIVEYDSIEFLEEYFGLDSSKVNFKGAFLEDAMLSLAVTKALFDEVDYSKINSFKMDRHRQEEVIDKKGRLWVNDSKATNIDASIKAIDGYSSNFIRLILGGVYKGADLEPYFKFLSTKDLKLYLIGEDFSNLKELAQKYNIDFCECGTLKRAVEQIDKEMRDKDIALLSPASASFDQFKSYKDRGEQFLTFIEEIVN